jgi:hypothetical protein
MVKPFRNDDNNPFLTNLDLANHDVFADAIRDVDVSLFSRFDTINKEPYRPEDLMYNTETRGRKSLDGAMYIATKYAPLEWDRTSTLFVEDWIRLFAFALQAQDIQNKDVPFVTQLALRLAMTDPVKLFPSSSWENNRLTPDYHGHNAWTAAYLIFGAPWNDRNEWFPRPTTQGIPMDTQEASSPLKRKSPATP